MQLTHIQSNYAEPHKLAVFEYGERKSHAIVLLHGFTHNAKFFEPLAKYLEEKGLYVIVPDMPGRGASEYLSLSKNYNYHLYVNDLFLILNYLKIETVDIMGNSMGGVIAVMFTEKYPKMVHKLIMNDIGFNIPSSEIMRVGKYVGRDFTKADKNEMMRRIDEEFRQSGLSIIELEYIFDNYTIKIPEGYIFNYDQKISSAFWLKDRQIPIPDLDFSDSFSNIRKTCKHLQLYIIRGEISNMLDEENFEKLAECNQYKDNMIVSQKGHLPIFFDKEQMFKISRWLSN